MTPVEFQQNHSGWLKELFGDPRGKEFIALLNGMRPSLPQSFPTEHAALRAYANIEGYEQCLRTMIALSQAPKAPAASVPANYGVPDKEKAIEGKTETK